MIGVGRGEVVVAAVRGGGGGVSRSVAVTRAVEQTDASASA